MPLKGCAIQRASAGFSDVSGSNRLAQIGATRRGRHIGGGRGGNVVGERVQTLRVSKTRKVFGRCTADHLNFADAAERHSGR
jgi:hypothetical protein